MHIHPSRGRPFGGRAFIINKQIKILKHDFINKHLATLTCDFNSMILTLISCYLPYDNGTQLNLSEFNSSLQVIYELISFFESLNHSVLIFGDFNADLLRNKRFDIIFENFIKNNDLNAVPLSYDPLLFSYMNGDYKAKLDHCLMSSSIHSFNIINCEFIDDVINLSDHKPLLIIIKLDMF